MPLDTRTVTTTEIRGWKTHAERYYVRFYRSVTENAHFSLSTPTSRNYEASLIVFLDPRGSDASLRVCTR